ncbi:MAG: DUF1295 domain-containing protein [Kofleriaceae bacterium]
MAGLAGEDLDATHEAGEALVLVRGPPGRVAEHHRLEGMRRGGDTSWQALWHPDDTRARSTPLLPHAFPSDHASVENSSLVLPFRPVQDRRISNASIVGENYFFEWIYWLGLAVHGLAFAPWGLVALSGQAIIVASIFGVTGIPPTEAQALRSRGDAYRAYQQRVSRFVPWPPKPRRDEDA